MTDVKGESVNLATYWKEEIKKERKAHQKWIDYAEECEKAYSADKHFNIFWSNVQVLHGALFSNTPSAEVRRRHKDGNDAQRSAAQILERSLDFMVDSTDFEAQISRAVDEFLVVGMGQVRVRYKPEFEQVPVIDPISGMEEITEVIASQVVHLEFFSWKDFGWQPSKTWDKVEYVYFNHYLTKSEIEKDYGVDLNEDEDLVEDSTVAKRVKVTEIYHKPTRSVIVICDQCDSPLEVRKEALGVEGVFPCPKPMMANVSHKVSMPVPDFVYYKKQAEHLNKAVESIDQMAKGVKDVGFYDAHFTELASLKNKPNGALVPVEDLIAKLNGADLENVIAKKPIKETVESIIAMQGYVERKKSEIYEITGISDIVRGETSASETATAQDIKTQFATIRLREKQLQVAMFVRDCFRIMSEVIGEHFTPEVLTKMTGVEANEEVMAILRDDVMRNFSVDVESDSTIAREESQERQQRMEALQAISSYMQGLLPAMAQGAIPMDVGKELLLLSVRGFKYTGNLEDMIHQMGGEKDQQIQQLMQQSQQLQQQVEQMGQELQKHSQVDSAHKAAQIGKLQAETELKGAEAQEQQIENAANVTQLQAGMYPVAMG
jgi:hypothetical protein